jgi:hypothetical protein
MLALAFPGIQNFAFSGIQEWLYAISEPQTKILGTEKRCQEVSSWLPTGTAPVAD